MTEDVAANSAVLNSWKEIARYLDRGVRTVQRWETLGLPVHRPGGRGRSAVFAIKSELDEWLRSCPTEARQEVLSNGHATILDSKAAEPRKLFDNHATGVNLTAQLILEAKKMRGEMLQCREQLRETIAQLHKSISQMSSPSVPGTNLSPSTFAIFQASEPPNGRSKSFQLNSERPFTLKLPES